MNLIEAIKKKIEVRNKYKKRMRTFNEFLIKDPKRPSVELSPEMQKYYNELRENGIVKIENMFVDIADYINEAYFDKAEKDLSSITQWCNSTQTDRTKEMGRTVNLNISFADQNLKNLFFNDGLMGIIYNYYQRQPYFRNLPALAKVEFGEENKVDIQGKFHLDGGLNQISFMLLTNDITENDTHMEYALHTNNLPVPYNDNRFSWEDSEIENKYKLYNLVGKKGTLFIFDAGNGYHRAVYKKGSTRKILHLNLTTGHSLTGQCEHDGANFDFIKDRKDYTQEAIKKLLCRS